MGFCETNEQTSSNIKKNETHKRGEFVSGFSSGVTIQLDEDIQSGFETKPFNGVLSVPSVLIT